MAERDFKGIWIPKKVWLDTRLSATDKIILAEIDSLDMSDKGCFISNERLAEFAQCSVTKASTTVSLLIKLGYVVPVSFDGRTRILKSCLSKIERLPFNFCKQSNTDIEPDIDYSKEKDIPIGISKKKGTDSGCNLLGEFENVKLTDAECTKLEERLGDKGRDAYIERLSGYIQQKGVRYKSHYATILNWWRKDGEPVDRSFKEAPMKPDTPRIITSDMTAEEVFG